MAFCHFGQKMESTAGHLFVVKPEKATTDEEGNTGTGERSLHAALYGVLIEKYVQAHSWIMFCVYVFSCHNNIDF